MTCITFVCFYVIDIFTCNSLQRELKVKESNTTCRAVQQSTWLEARQVWQNKDLEPMPEVLLGSITCHSCVVASTWKALRQIWRDSKFRGALESQIATIEVIITEQNGLNPKVAWGPFSWTKQLRCFKDPHVLTNSFKSGFTISPFLQKVLELKTALNHTGLTQFLLKRKLAIFDPSTVG